MLGLFVFGTLWFWLAIITLIIVDAWLVEVGKGTGAAFVLLFGVVTLYYLGAGATWAIIPYIVEHPWNTLGYVGIYFMIGMVWSVVKWGFKLRKMKNSGYKHAPEIAQYKQDFMRWIGYWPFSVIASVFSDLIREIVDFLADKMSAVYQKMADWVFAK